MGGSHGGESGEGGFQFARGVVEVEAKTATDLGGAFRGMCAQAGSGQSQWDSPAQWFPKT